VVIARGGESDQPCHQVAEHGQIAIALAAVHLIQAQRHQPGELQRGVDLHHRPLAIGGHSEGLEVASKAFAEGVEMPPDSDLRAVVANHLSVGPGSYRGGQLRPKLPGIAHTKNYLSTGSTST
jgi:hypothetical protein